MGVKKLAGQMLTELRKLTPAQQQKFLAYFLDFYAPPSFCKAKTGNYILKNALIEARK